MNIILFGFMGTGKSVVGKTLARRLGLKFLDMDCVIEERQGRAIADLFAQEGEAAFRRMEKELVRELAGRDGLVISTGGGVPLDPENIALLEPAGLCVCLQASPETIYERIRRKTHRPLLRHPDPQRRIRELLAQRESCYARIPHQIATDGLSPAQIADRIAALAKEL